MWRVTFRGLLAKKFRLVLTSLAVVLGVAFMAGTFVLTDTLGHVFDNLFRDDAGRRRRRPRQAEPFDSEPSRVAARTRGRRYRTPWSPSSRASTAWTLAQGNVGGLRARHRQRR